MSVGVAEFSRGIPEAYGDGEDIALTPPLSAIPRRSPEGANRAGSGRRRLPDRRIGNLVAPSRHPGVTHAALHDPVQLPVRLTGWRTRELRDARIEVRTSPLTGAQRAAVAPGAGLPVDLQPRDQHVGGRAQRVGGARRVSGD